MDGTKCTLIRVPEGPVGSCVHHRAKEVNEPTSKKEGGIESLETSEGLFGMEDKGRVGFELRVDLETKDGAGYHVHCEGAHESRWHRDNQYISEDRDN